MIKNKLIPELRFPEFQNEGEWIESLLGSEAEIKGRIGYRGYTISDIVEKGKGAITLSPSNFDENGRLKFEKCTYITWEKYEESPEIMLEIGQTVLVKTASVGKTAYVESLPEKATVNPQIVVLKPKKIFNRFLSNSVAHQNTQLQINNCVGAGAIPNISQEIISKLKILVPPDKERKEQQKIASCLSSLDEVIAAHSQKLDLLKDHKKGLMQKLFPQEGAKVPKYRFQEFENNGEWLEKTLNEITPLIFDGTHQTPKYTDNGIPFFSVENLISGKKNKFISKEDHLIATNKNKPEKFDILLTRIGNIGFPKVIDWDYEFSIYVTLAVIKKSKEFNSYYLYSFIQSDFYQKEIKSKSLLNATPCKINMDELRKTKISLPPDNEHKEQQKIASCLSSLDALIKAQVEKIEQLKLLKKGLMQGLFPKIND